MREGKILMGIWAVVFAAGLLSWLTGCTPEARLSRLLKHHPELATTKTITEYKHDTLITKEVHKDTVFNNIFSKDTIFLHKDKLTIKYVYKGGDSAYIGGKMLPDTLVRIDTIKAQDRTIIQQVDRPLDGFDNFCRWAVILGIIFVVIRYGGPAIVKAFGMKLPF